MNTHTKKFYTTVWIDVWSLLKLIIQFILMVTVGVMIIIIVTYTGLVITDWLSLLPRAPGVIIILFGITPYSIIATMYYLWKYLKQTWHDTKEENNNV